MDGCTQEQKVETSCAEGQQRAERASKGQRFADGRQCQRSSLVRTETQTADVADSQHSITHQHERWLWGFCTSLDSCALLHPTQHLAACSNHCRRSATIFALNKQEVKDRLTWGGLKYAVAHVMASIRFCRASDRGFARGSWEPALQHTHVTSSLLKYN